jgi:hypothetical protein
MPGAGTLHARNTAGGIEMREDPILAELRQIRRDIRSQFNGDMDALYLHLKSIEDNERSRGRLVVDRSRSARRHPDAA